MSRKTIYGRQPARVKTANGFTVQKRRAESNAPGDYHKEVKEAADRVLSIGMRAVLVRNKSGSV